MLNAVLPRILGFGLLFICLYAIAAGTWRERLAGVTYLAGYCVLLGFEFISTSYRVPYQLISDTLCLPSFLIIAWKSPVLWPRFALAAQLASLFIDITILFYRTIDDWTYTATQNALGSALLVSLLAGTLLAQRRRRQEKEDAANV